MFWPGCGVFRDMPVKSDAQWNAMQAAKHGDPDKLYGAAKDIRNSMKKKDLNDFTRKKPGNLPKHVKESTESVAKLFGRSLLGVMEGAEAAIEQKVQHFIKTMQTMPGQMGDEWLQSTMQEIEGLAQGRNDPQIQKYYPGWQPADFQKLYNRVMMHFYGGGAGMAEANITPAERVALLLGEKGHPPTCDCGFCRNKGSFGKKAKDDEKASEKKIDEPSEPEVSEASIQQKPYVDKTGKQRMVPWVTQDKPKDKTKEPVKEAFQGTVVPNKPGSNMWRKPSPTCVVCGKPRRGAVDRQLNANEVCSPECLKKKRSGSMGAYLPTPPAGTHTALDALRQESGTDVKLSKGVNLGGKAASAYHNMTSKQAMTPGWKPKAYIKAAGEISGNAKHGQMKSFKNRSAAETTTGKHIESRVPGAAAKQIVEALLG